MIFGLIFSFSQDSENWLCHEAIIQKNTAYFSKEAVLIRTCQFGLVLGLSEPTFFKHLLELSFGHTVYVGRGSDRSNIMEYNNNITTIEDDPLGCCIACTFFLCQLPITHVHRQDMLSENQRDGGTKNTYNLTDLTHSIQFFNHFLAGGLNTRVYVVHP